MSAPKSKQNYLNNPNLPTADAVHEYTPEMVSEIKKCQTSILHFAENYFHIVSLDEGKQTITLHPCQKRALRKMRDNRFFILLASRQIGKALALDTKIKTTKGWSTMGQLKAGDQVYGTNGKACNVVYTHDTLHNRDCYRVTFDNGEQIVADADHLWYTQDHYDRCWKRPPLKRTTAEMAKTLTVNKKHPQANYSIPHVGPIEYTHQTLPIDPYHLGLWLGDGSRWSPSITVGKEDVEEVVKCINIESEKIRITESYYGHYTIAFSRVKYNNKKFATHMRELNLYKNKHIPQIYINSSIEQRLELIRGLMDTDGTVNGTMNTFYNTNKLLIDQMQEILHSLRIKTVVSRYDFNKSPKGKPGLPIYKISFATFHSVFKLPRKKSKQNISQSTHTQNVFIKNIEKVDSVPVRCITVDNKEGCFLCGETNICSSNTTLMTIYALWIACFVKDQSILIVANKEDTAIEIFRRIRLAYEELPNWIKPGIKGSYGKTSMELANGTMIGISTTTGTAARGKSINVLILDELAFIEQHLVNEFWKSVYPIVSSSKKSKIFIASTANGTGNLFHTLYSGAESSKNGWECDKILWSEIPGRNELWKLQTIATIGSREAFDQEFGCEFIDAGDSTIDEEIYEKLSVSVKQPKYTMDEGSYQIWEEPKDDRIYVVGVDVSEGVGKDSSVINILDMTDLTAIKQVACWANNQIPPQKFTTVVHEVLTQWGKPLVCIERNNCGAQVVDNLRALHNYENIVSWGASTAGRSKDQLGIVAHTNTKFTGITNMRYWVNQLQTVQIRDIKLLKELKNFVRSANGTWAAKKGTNYHDDLVMSLVWSLIILEQNIVQKYFEVQEFDINHRPLIIKQMDFGIKYFTNPGSIYNDNGEYDTAMPCIMGNNMKVDDEMSSLQQQGYKFLQ